MGAMEMLIILLLSFLGMYLLFILCKFFHKVWWTPIRIQYMMGKQGIKGPSYKFLYGNAKEIINMRNEAMRRPMDISHHIFTRIQPHLHSWISIYGINYLNWHGPQAQLVVTESELIKEILNNKDGAFPKSEPPVFVKKLLGNGLVSSQGEKWMKSRKLANHAFNGESLKVKSLDPTSFPLVGVAVLELLICDIANIPQFEKSGMIAAMISSTEMMLKRWKEHEGKEIEVFEEFRLLTAEVISRTAFGSSYLEGKHIFEMLSKLVVITSRNAYKVRFPGISKIFKTSDDIESEKLVKGIRESILEMIKNREKKVTIGELDSYGSDFLGLLVQSYQDADKKKRISVDVLVDECKTFYIAGQETTNTLLAWTVFLLAIHTDWQEEARKEVLKVFGQQIPNSDGIARLKSMNMIINESLRLYPPVAGLTRKVGGEIRLGKIVFPANMGVYISILALHQDPHVWGEDVHLFKPERFSEGVAKATNNNMAAFLPFGLGPRSCAGLNFASTEAKVALSIILQRYSFTLSPAYVHSPYHLLTIRPHNGVQVMLHVVKGED